jgi:ATPase subunit of ABC transporter with duplicated ATPase domains
VIKKPLVVVRLLERADLGVNERVEFGQIADEGFGKSTVHGCLQRQSESVSGSAQPSEIEIGHPPPAGDMSVGLH